MSISKIQVEKLQKNTPQERYGHSIKMIADFEEMYSLLDENDSWQLAEVEGKGAFFLWSAKEYAEPFVKNQWANCKIEKITVEEFYDEIADFLKEHEYLLNIFAIDNHSGFVVTVDEFIRDLENETENYE